MLYNDIIYMVSRCILFYEFSQNMQKIYCSLKTEMCNNSSKKNTPNEFRCVWFLL